MNIGKDILIGKNDEFGVNMLSIVVPCYNEEKNLDTLLVRFDRVIDASSMELIIVDNGSTDNTWQYLEKAKAKYSYLRPVRVEVNVGYGNGILEGLKHASGDVLAWTHADLQTDPEDILRAYDLYKTCSIDRPKLFIKGYRINRKLGEKFFSFGMQILASIVLGISLSEVNAQPKLFPRSFFNLMKNPPNDFSLDLYVLYLAKKVGYEIMSLPVNFKNRLHGEAKGGGGSNFTTRIKLIKRTFKYIFELKEKVLSDKIK